MSSVRSKIQLTGLAIPILLDGTVHGTCTWNMYMELFIQNVLKPVQSTFLYYKSNFPAILPQQVKQTSKSMLYYAILKLPVCV